MEFLLNERSIHGQFQSAAAFCDSVDTVMEIRQAIRRFGRELRCHNSITHAPVTPAASMQEVVQRMPLEKRRVWLQWVTTHGPFWTDDRQHPASEWLEVSDGVDVVDSAVGEAAYCRMRDLDRDLVSFVPSDWLEPRIKVTWISADETPFVVEVPNHWSVETVIATLQDLPTPFHSWETLASHVRTRFNRLNFTDDAFAALDGQPYVPGAADRIVERLNILDIMCGCFDEQGRRTAEGDRLYQEHFTGDKAWFSDSSDSEKREFESKLRFRHPEKPGDYLNCPWHGKVKTPQLRIHFSWPIAANLPVYVVYVGPKLTKR